MSFTLPANGFLSGLLGDADIAALFSDSADLTATLEFEVALAAAQATLGLIPEMAAADIRAACTGFSPDSVALDQRVRTDGLAIPGLIAQLREALPKDSAAHLHFKTTSQDAIDTSVMLRLRAVFGILTDRLDQILAGLDSCQARFGEVPLMGQTRMQPALPISVGDRIAAWRAPLQRLRAEIEPGIRPLLSLQLAGPVGCLDLEEQTATALRAQLAAALGLSDPGGSWQTDRTRIVDIATWLSKLAGALGKVGQDITLMAQADPPTVALKRGGSSSAMPHKNNPIQAEVLVTLAGFCATQMSGFHGALVHEQERSGAAWTLEWMLLPSLCVATGASTRIALELLNGIERLGSER